MCRTPRDDRRRRPGSARRRCGGGGRGDVFFYPDAISGYFSGFLVDAPGAVFWLFASQMSESLIRIDASDLLRRASLIGKASKNLDKVIAQSLNEGGDKVRTDVRRALQKQSGARAYKVITERTRSVRAYEGFLRYTIIGNPKTTNIKDFKASLKRGAGGGVSASPWGIGRQFARSFSLGGSDPSKFRIRTTNARFPIRKPHGPNIAKEMLTGNVPTVFILSVSAQIGPVMFKRIQRALGLS